MISVELEVLSHWVTHYDPLTNEQLLLESLDMIYERRTEAKLRALYTDTKSFDIITSSQGSDL